MWELASGDVARGALACLQSLQQLLLQRIHRLPGCAGSGYGRCLDPACLRRYSDLSWPVVAARGGQARLNPRGLPEQPLAP